MPTANNLIRFAAFPVYNALEKQYRYRKGVEFGDNCTYVHPTFSFALPPFIIKRTATANGLTRLTVRNLDNSVYISLPASNMSRYTINENGVLYDYIIYYGGILFDNGANPVDMACGIYYASIDMEGDHYYTELFQVYEAYNTEEEGIISNGEFEYNLDGWQYDTSLVSWSAGRAAIEGSPATAPLRQDLTPETAPFQYELTLDIELDAGTELRVRFTDGTSITRTIIYPASGVYTEIINNPKQIRFETSTFGLDEYAYINSVSLKKVTTLDCFNRFVWGNNCTLNGIPYVITSGNDVNRFAQSAMFTALVSSPRFEHTIEPSENEAGETVKNFESLERRVLVAASPLPQFVVDALQLLPLHDTVTFIDIDNNILQPDYTEANEPEQVLENIYFTQNIELVDEVVSDANCCDIISIICPTEIPLINLQTVYDEEAIVWVVTVNPDTPVSGYENALFQLYYDDISILESCELAGSPTYAEGGAYSQEQLNAGGIVFTVSPDSRRHCYYLRVSMPQCPDINNGFTNIDSFNANIPQ